MGGDLIVFMLLWRLGKADCFVPSMAMQLLQPSLSR